MIIGILVGYCEAQNLSKHAVAIGSGGGYAVFIDGELYRFFEGDDEKAIEKAHTFVRKHALDYKVCAEVTETKRIMTTITVSRAGGQVDRSEWPEYSLQKNYRTTQLNSITAESYGGFFKCQFSGEGKTNWLNITIEEFEQIKAILINGKES